MRIKKTGKLLDGACLALKTKKTKKGTGKVKKRRKPPLILVDSNYLGYQALYTTGGLEYAGKPVGVIFGFLGQMLTAVKQFQSDRLVFCWDSKKNLRSKLYPEYKVNRHKDKTEEELQAIREAHVQFKELRKEILPELGFPNVFCKKGYEADDIIASIALSGSIKGKRIIISSDEDMFQLVSKRTCIWNPRTGRIVNSRWWRDHHSIEPSQWAMVKAIAGCTSDNVKGIDGVGETKAEQYLAGEMPKHYKAYQQIQEGGEIIERNRELVTLPFNDLKPPRVRKRTQFDITPFQWLFNRYGFRSFYWEGDNWDEWKKLAYGVYGRR